MVYAEYAMIRYPSNETDDDGIIHEIRRTNLNEFYHFVGITASSTQVDERNWGTEKVLLNYDLPLDQTWNNWCSTNTPNSSFIISFHQFRLRITNYSMRSRGTDVFDMPKSWVVEGSNDNTTWKYIDQQLVTTCFKEINKVHTFQVSHSGLYRYFRFTHHKTNHHERNFFCLGKVDLFGISKSDSISCINKDSNIVDFNVYIYIFIIIN